MTITDVAAPAGTGRPAAPSHPLASLTAAEIDAVRAVVLALPSTSDATRFAYVGLEEPAKPEVLAWEAGAPLPERRARVQLLDMRTTSSLDLVVSLASGEVVSSVELDGTAGQLPILDAEFEEVGLIANADEGWVAALAAGRARYLGITDDEALQAFHLLAHTEGILPALESSHALAQAIKLARERPRDQIVLCNLSGRGDKDVHTIAAREGLVL